MQPISLVTPEYAERRSLRANSDCPELWEILDSVYDPELPHVTIWDLGILVDVKCTTVPSTQLQHCTVIVSPTYSGCPAVDVISDDIKSALQNAGIPEVDVQITLSPAWHTDLMSPQAKAALHRQGIAPPAKTIQCPQCDSEDIQLISQFGSTACKALYRCNSCLEPFDYFKDF